MDFIGFRERVLPVGQVLEGEASEANRFVAGFVKDGDGAVFTDGEAGVCGRAGIDNFSFAPGFAFVIADLHREIFSSACGVGVAEEKAVSIVTVFDGCVTDDAAVAAGVDLGLIDHEVPAFAVIVRAMDAAEAFAIEAGVDHEGFVGELNDLRFVGRLDGCVDEAPRFSMVLAVEEVEAVF